MCDLLGAAVTLGPSPTKRARPNAEVFPPAPLPSPGPFSALPTDLIECIVAFAPLRARLRALSLVCKRWRIAVLRSITHIRLTDRNLRDHTELSVPLAAAAVSLLPRLASLTLVGDLRLCDLSPPPALTALSLRHNRGGPRSPPSYAWACAHLPHLTRLTIRDDTGLLHSGLLTDFIVRHRASLTRLKLRGASVPHQWLPALSKAGLPQLRRLSVGTFYARDVATFDALMRVCPLVNEISLVAEREALERIPIWHLNVLTHLTLMGDIDVEFLDRLPRLKRVKAGSEGNSSLKMCPQWRDFRWLMARHGWEALRAQPRLRSLVLSSCDMQTSSVPLPCLRRVTVDYAPHNTTRLRAFVSALLRQYPHVEKLQLHGSGGGAHTERDATLLADLCEIGVRHGLRRIVWWERTSSQLADLGWLELVTP